MRVSLTEIKETEDFLSGRLTTQHRLVYEAKLLINPTLSVNTIVQEKIRLVVKAFHRKKIKQELRTIHDELFSNPDKIEFQQKVLRYFNR